MKTFASISLKGADISFSRGSAAAGSSDEDDPHEDSKNAYEFMMAFLVGVARALIRVVVKAAQASNSQPGLQPVRHGGCGIINTVEKNSVDGERFMLRLLEHGIFSQARISELMTTTSTPVIGADANLKMSIKSSYGPTDSILLHFTCGGSNHDAMHILLSHGVDVNAVNDDRQTPLHLACTNKDWVPSDTSYRTEDYKIKRVCKSFWTLELLMVQTPTLTFSIVTVPPLCTSPLKQEIPELLTPFCCLVANDSSATGTMQASSRYTMQHIQRRREKSSKFGLYFLNMASWGRIYISTPTAHHGLIPLRNKQSHPLQIQLSPNYPSQASKYFQMTQNQVQRLAPNPKPPPWRTSPTLSKIHSCSTTRTPLEPRLWNYRC